MPLVINSNIAALNSQRQLVKSGDDLMQAMERLSSGKRINTAADDAAGLAISNRMTSQVMGLNQAVRNANDGISLIQTAEGALDETTNILQRIRELAIQSANGIYADGDRQTLDAEVQQLLSELDRIAATTSFNGQNLLDGTLGDVDLQIGSESNQVINFSISAMTSDKLGLGTTSSDISGARVADLLDLDNTIAPGAISIGDGDVLINNQSIGAFNGGTDTFQDLIDNINTNVDGVTASGYNIAEAGAVGTGAIVAGDALTISVFDVDGSRTARTDFTFTSSNSLEELVTSINTKTGGLLTASVSEAGKLVLSNSTGAAIALSYENTVSTTDTLAGVLGFTDASIVNQGGINSADTQYVAGADDAALLTGALALTSDDGGTLTIGAGPEGVPADLANLGFQDSSADGTVTGLGNGATVPAGTVDFSEGLEAGDLTINGTVIPATVNDSLQGAIDIINTVTDETGVVAASIATQAFDEQTSIAATELVANAPGTYAFTTTDTITVNGVVTGAYGGTSAASVATAINLISDDTGVSAFVDDNDALHLFSPGPIVLTNGAAGLVTDFGDLEDAFNVGTNVVTGAAVQAGGLSGAGASDIVINGQVVGLSNLGDLSSLVTDINGSEAQTGVHAEIDDNGELSLSSNSNIAVQLGTTRSAMTAAHAIGVTDLITDADVDGALDATSFSVGAGIKLTSINGTTISIDGNASGQTATGLLSQNTDLSSIATGSAISSVSVATQAGAQAAINPIDNALETINATRSQMGAVTNRLDFTISNLMNVSENTAAARSRIVDADFAAETANLSRAQVLQQASQAMLAQANAAPQRVLQLLNS